MANTGILYRRNTKSQLISDPPIPGEIVFALDTEEYGAIEATELIWRKHIDAGLSSLPDVYTSISGDAIGSSIHGVDESVTVNVEVTKATNSFSVGPTTKTTEHSFVTGKYNVGQALTVVEIGIGTGVANKVNALEVYEDGKILAPSTTKTHIFSSKQALVTREYIDDLAIDCGIYT